MSEPASGINGRILRQDQERATTNMLDDGDRFTRPREKRDDLLVVHVRATEAAPRERCVGRRTGNERLQAARVRARRCRCVQIDCKRFYSSPFHHLIGHPILPVKQSRTLASTASSSASGGCDTHIYAALGRGFPPPLRPRRLDHAEAPGRRTTAPRRATVRARPPRPWAAARARCLRGSRTGVPRPTGAQDAPLLAHESQSVILQLC